MNLDEIAARYVYKAEDLVPINDGFQNTVYQLGNHHVLRMGEGNRRNINELENEMKFILFLDNMQIPVSKPIPSNNGQLIEKVENIHIVAFEKANGAAIEVTDPNVWNTDLFHQWGKLIGKMHKVSNLIDLDRPRWTEEDPDILKLLPKISSHPIRQRYIEQLEELKSFKQDLNLFGLIHNDFHQGNFFVKDGRITFFDFDDCAYHWFAYDLAVSFYHAYWQASSFTPEQTDFSKIFWCHFLKGYREEHDINREMIEQIPIFLKIREIFLYVLFLEKWDLQNLKDWQTFTLEDLKHKIGNNLPYSNVDFNELIDNIS
ncbi:phosphotransferase [Neobacillus pocheonensis]|uniref:phosphotransferase enzyme family protein n=1 Tax=Neobacillus pocheonensis TaxID=363869 RepID=UPI003D290951